MILVTGDVVLDHNVYEGARLTPDAPAGSGSFYLRTSGGAMLIYELLKALDPERVSFGLTQTAVADLQSWPEQFQIRAVWRPAANGDKVKDGRHWALQRNLGYGEPDKNNTKYPGTSVPAILGSPPRILVIDDGALGFREKESDSSWPGFLKADKRPAGLEWVILKMSRPLACGDLWLHLMNESWRERLIAIVSADQLRSEGLRVAGGLSWETSVDDIVEELESNRALRGFRQCRHLIVTMRSDAALWLDQPVNGDPTHCQLIFDRQTCEGEWEERHKEWKAYGFVSTITASVAWSLSAMVRQKEDPKRTDKSPVDQVDFTVPLAAGLSGTRFLRGWGHGPAPGAPKFPFKETAEHLKSEGDEHGKDPRHGYSSTEVRCEGGACRVGEQPPTSARWTILGQVSPWHAARGQISYEPARRVALLGPDKLKGVPCATFGRLQTLDRHEIDSLRSLRQLMLMYRDGSGKQPLCLAVFGTPGSGKSFGLKQIAAGVFGSDNPVPEFNLSQFNGVTDLIGAFHQVRDKALSGATPVVFWDEFDSKKLEWLQYFLAPMQDGAFQEGQITHSVGRAVFVFAGGTCHSFDEFSKPPKKSADHFKAMKGPDFISRLAGYLDIAGPNPREADPDTGPDLEYPVRRAAVIRTALDLGSEPLQIERGLLTALLAAGKYCNGARSLSKLVTYIKERGGIPLRRAYLPPDDILALYVEDVKQFHALTRKASEFHAQAERLARAIHADYVQGLSEEDRKVKPNAKPWDELSADIRDSNLAAALRIPWILELAGLTLEGATGPGQGVRQIPKGKIEKMAEAEHGGWEEQKRIDGWTYSRDRNDAALRHNLLVPYDRLTEEIKDFDRSTVRNYPKYVDDAGFRIVPLHKQKADSTVRDHRGVIRPPSLSVSPDASRGKRVE